MVGALHQKLWEIIFGYFVALGAISPTAQGESAQAEQKRGGVTQGGVPRRGPACRWSAGGGSKRGDHQNKKSEDVLKLTWRIIYTVFNLDSAELRLPPLAPLRVLPVLRRWPQAWLLKPPHGKGRG